MRRKTLLSILLATGLGLMNPTMASIEPVSAPLDFVMQETPRGIFYITRYRTPERRNYKTWSEFYFATKREGYSIDRNTMYSSSTIKSTEQTSKPRKRDHGGSCIGHTKGSIPLVVGESIAVDPKRIPIGSLVKINFLKRVYEKPCISKRCYHYEPCTTQSCIDFNGTYLANDIGVKGNQIDLFTGLELGTHKGKPFSLGEDLPSYAEITITNAAQQEDTKKLLASNRPKIFYKSTETANQDKSNKLAYRKK